VTELFKKVLTMLVVKRLHSNIVSSAWILHCAGRWKATSVVASY